MGVLEDLTLHIPQIAMDFVHQQPVYSNKPDMRRFSPDRQLEAQVREREDPVQDVGDDLNRSRVARVAKESTDDAPEVVVIVRIVTYAPRWRILEAT